MKLLSIKGNSCIAFFLLIIILGSCRKNWLQERTDQSITVPTTLIDFQNLLNYTGKMNLQFGDMREVASDGHYFSATFFSGPSQTLNAYTWTKHVPFLAVKDWNNSYSLILVCNIVLEGLEKFKPENSVDQALWDRLKGEALFLRSYYFFDIAQTFAPPYKSSTANSDLGIPLRLNSDLTELSIRSTVEETYKRIVEDLKLAIPLLPSLPIYKTNPSKWAANAMLSRVYLSMEEYAKAKEYADACLFQSGTLMNYNNDNEINPSLSTPFSQVLNKEIIFFSTLFLGRTNYLIDTALFKAYSSSDLRRSMFYRVTGTGANISVTFKGCYGSTSLFSGLATDEIYLIRSECNARLGNRDAALQDLNSLLIKRYQTGNFVPVSAVDADDALAKVLIERKKELILRGLRWSDLRRLNRDPRFAVTLNRYNVLGVNYSLEPNSLRYTFPIPDDIIQYSGVQQNPGWQ